MNNDGQVDVSDMLYIILYSRNPSITLPNNGDISLGDVNGDGMIDSVDALLLSTYLNDPSDPSLPAGIGEPVGAITTTASQTWKLYWTDTGTDKIQRSNLDGSGVEDLVITGLESLGDIALDVSGGKLYWTDSGTDKIQRSNLDGSRVKTLVTELEFPNSIALGFVPVEAGPDLVVRASVRDTLRTPGQSFTLSATVRNQGSEQAAATTLRYYRSGDATISTRDTRVGTDAVGALAAADSSAESIRLTSRSSGSESRSPADYARAEPFPRSRLPATLANSRSESGWARLGLAVSGQVRRRPSEFLEQSTHLDWDQVVNVGSRSIGSK